MYRLIIAPSLYLVSDTAAADLANYVGDGRGLVVSFFSGIVDSRDHVRLGGYPDAFRDVLGIVVEEFFPLRTAGSVSLLPGGTGSQSTELVRLAGAEALARYGASHLGGQPALTRHGYHGGDAWYVSTPGRRDSGRVARRHLQRARRDAGGPHHPGSGGGPPRGGRTELAVRDQSQRNRGHRPDRGRPGDRRARCGGGRAVEPPCSRPGSMSLPRVTDVAVVG